MKIDVCIAFALFKWSYKTRTRFRTIFNWKIGHYCQFYDFQNRFLFVYDVCIAFALFKWSYKTRNRFRTRFNWKIDHFCQFYDFQNRSLPNWGTETLCFDLIVSPAIILQHFMQFEGISIKIDTSEGIWILKFV